MRIYKKGKQKYLSVTTILDMMFPFNEEQFKKWAYTHGYSPEQILDDSKRIGTMLHERAENKFLGMEFFNTPAVDQKEKGYQASMDKFLSDYELIESENTVYCKEYGYAGTYDAICRRDDKTYLCDFKSYGAWKGKYKRDSAKLKKLSLQLSMYKYAFSKETDGLLGIMLLPNGEYIVENLKEVPSWKDWIDENQYNISELLK